MQIRAIVQSSDDGHAVSVSTDGRVSAVSLSGRPGGGSALNGGELLCAALATCFCNDVYREAAKRGIAVDRVEVTVQGEFGAQGASGTNITYQARVTAQASEAEIRALLEHTDQVAEIHNTLRVGTPVTLEQIEAVPVPPVGA